jgi:transposase
MGTASVHEGVRRMRFSSLWEQTEAKDLTQEEAALILGISVRTFQRWGDRYEADGEAGLQDGRLHRPSPKRADERELERMLGLYRETYSDFTVKHFHDQLVNRHGYRLGYTVTRLTLQGAGLVKPAPSRSAHRKKRPRRPMRGMLLHQDGSRHVWIEGLPALDLIVTLDDATSEIYAMELVSEEGTASTFSSLREVMGTHGLFCALYTDRGSHYFHTPIAGERVSKDHKTQVGRALSTLGIEHIAAYSPEARGRSERAFRTLQDRLPKELRLAGITTVAAANAWFKRTYMADHNSRFAIAPEDARTAFLPDRHEAWRETLCVIEARQVGQDNTIAWSGMRLQLPESRLRPHFVKATVAVHAYPDGTLSVFWGPHRLATFTAAGVSIETAGAASPPTPSSLAPCSTASRTSPRGRPKWPSLTPPARVADRAAWVGTKERASSRTKEQTRRQGSRGAA